MDDRDYRVFLSYLKVALSSKLEEEAKTESLTEIEEARLRRLRLHKDIELLSYCLMPNHFHLFVYQHGQFAIRDLMRSIMTGYVVYFNKRYKRVGGLFQGRYKASLIDNDVYLRHVSRYIHINPKKWETYPYSSYKYFKGSQEAEWVKPDRILELFDNDRNDYHRFLTDYKDYRENMEDLSDYLATPIED